MVIRCYNSFLERQFCAIFPPEKHTKQPIKTQVYIRMLIYMFAMVIIMHMCLTIVIVDDLTTSSISLLHKLGFYTINNAIFCTVANILDRVTHIIIAIYSGLKLILYMLSKLSYYFDYINCIALGVIAQSIQLLVSN